MAGQGLQDLVGRVMIDGDFLQALVRDPCTILADYQLSQEERTSVLHAIAKLARVSATEQAGSLRHTLVKRWAT